MKDYLFWDGRMNRMRFWKCKLTLYATALIVSSELRHFFTPSDFPDAIFSQFLTIGAILTIFAGGLFFIYLDVCWTIQRFHDHGKSGVYFLWLFVPLVNICWAGVLLFSRGTEGPNEYDTDPLSRGYRPENVKTGLISFCVVVLGMSLILLISGFVSGDVTLANIWSNSVPSLEALLAIGLIAKTDDFSEDKARFIRTAGTVLLLLLLVTALLAGHSWMADAEFDRLIQSYEIEY